MDITFLIGNGFDLQNKLNTTFMDFFEYMEEKDLLDDENYIYRKFKETESNKKNEWSNFEKILGELTYEIPEKVEYDKFMDDLDGFRFNFIDYMAKQQEKFEINSINRDDILKKTATRFYGNLNDNERALIANIISKGYIININFINFNYTNTLSKVLKDRTHNYNLGNKQYSFTDAIAIHNTLEDGTFLGVDNIEQINSKVFTKPDLESLIKPQTNIQYGSDKVRKANAYINKSEIIYIFGMSLGETDITWWRKIGEWLKDNPRRHLIINHYTNDKKNVRSNPRTYLNKINSAKKEFLNHLEYDESVLEKLSKNIHISFNANNIIEIMTD